MEAKALNALTNLTALNLYNNSIGDDGMKALSILTNLTSLNLERNKFGDDGMKALSALVNLTSLNLELNDVGADGAKALSALTNLTFLELGWNSRPSVKVKPLLPEGAENQPSEDGKKDFFRTSSISSGFQYLGKQIEKNIQRRVQIKSHSIIYPCRLKRLTF